VSRTRTPVPLAKTAAAVTCPPRPCTNCGNRRPTQRPCRLTAFRARALDPRGTDPSTRRLPYLPLSRYSQEAVGLSRRAPTASARGRTAGWAGANTTSTSIDGRSSPFAMASAIASTKVGERATRSNAKNPFVWFPSSSAGYRKWPVSVKGLASVRMRSKVCRRKVGETSRIGSVTIFMVGLALRGRRLPALALRLGVGSGLGPAENVLRVAVREPVRRDPHALEVRVEHDREPPLDLPPSREGPLG